MSRILKVRLNHCNIFTTVQGSVIRNVSSTGSLIDNFDATHVAKPFEDIPGPRSFPFIGPLLNFLPGQFDVTILASDCVNDLYEEKYSAPSGPSLNLLFSIQVVYAVASENSKCQTMQTHESLGGLRGVELARTLHNKYGNIVKVGGFCGNEGLVWLFDPNTIEHVYRSENAMPVRPSFASLDYYRQRHNKVYDPDRFTGLASDHGEKWWEFRSKVNPVMLQPKTIILYKNVLADVTNDMIARIRSMREEKDMIKKNFYREMTLWALESVGVVALGTRLHCFDPKNSASKDLIRTVHELFEVVDKLDVGLSPWRYISTPKFRKAMKIFEEQEGLTKFFVDKAVQNMQENKGKNIETNDHEKPILEKLLEIDYDIAHVMAADMLIAGVDTASNTSIAALYFLANNPEKQNKLREEVLSQRTSYPYLWATIKESLRLMPPVYANVRLTTKEYNLLGFKIPKNVKLLFPHQFLSTSEKHYPRAGEFIPERWLVNKEDPLYYGNVHPFVNAPFGFGTRVCIGRRLAELEIKILLSEMVKNFQIGWKGEPLNIHSTTLNYVMEPFNFTFKDI